MYDPYRHLFLNDEGLLARRDMPRRVQTLRRETSGPVFSPLAEEGTALGYSSVTEDPDTGEIKLWYTIMGQGGLRLAVSPDGRDWIRRGPVLQDENEAPLDNACLAPAGRRLDPWFKGAREVGVCLFTEPPKPGQEAGLYAVHRLDGDRLEVRYPSVLPGKGDRSFLGYDSLEDEYLLVTRPYYGYIPGFRPIPQVEVVAHRMARMW